MTKPVILATVGCFWPGNDASGPNQSFAAVASALKHEFDFLLLARDRPLGETTGDAPEGWVDLGFARAKYLAPLRFGARGLIPLIKQTPHDLLWFNSVYDREFTLPALAMSRIGALRQTPILLSPRGEFGVGALEVKAAKKQVFLHAARTLGLWKGITWHATSEAEAKDMAAEAPRDAKIVVAPNLRLMLTPPPFQPPTDTLRIVFVGRIAPIKGLPFALELLARFPKPATFEVLGPPEDATTHAQALALADKLPPHIKVIWRGVVSSEEILEAHSRSDVLLLPTAGENFGHAIFEALACGVPALISDQTPWRNLEAKQAGWDLPLSSPDAFLAKLEYFAALPAEQRALWREGARDCARAYVEKSGAVEATSRMLHEAMR
jgi:glycosyltransferase involved in cell wall biosynthesis